MYQEYHKKNIAQAYMHLATAYGLTFVGIEGKSGVAYVARKKTSRVSQSEIQQATDRVDKLVYHDGLIGLCADYLGLELEIWGYENKALAEKIKSLTVLSAVLENPEHERYKFILSLVSDEERPLLTERVSELLRKLSYDRMKGNIERLLERMKEKSVDLAMMIMGGNHSSEFTDYLSQLYSEQNRPVNYYILVPNGLDEEDEEDIRLFLASQRITPTTIPEIAREGLMILRSQ